MKKLILTLIKLYKRYLSPANYGIDTCKYEPSCSQYAYEAIQKYGIFKGGIKSIKRILRCNPFSKGGYDPVK